VLAHAPKFCNHIKPRLQNFTTMYDLRIWCDDRNEWRWTDVKQRLDEGQIEVARTFDKWQDGNTSECSKVGCRMTVR
jgi:hypothetical protein